MKPALVACVSLSALLAAAEEPGPPQLPDFPSSKAFTFVVLGDNRGDDSGQQPAAFSQVLVAAALEKPVFILDSGDMIYGHSPDQAKIREEWRIYRETVARVRAPMFHVPGNHDIWDETSARRYQELWGPTYYAFSYGNTRFIGLDTETVADQIDEQQFQWLDQQLRQCTQQNVFLFLHRPLFPVADGIGSSLDEYPGKRDRLHHLFVEHRDRIRGVFAGHEHLYNSQERDGVRYYISGGGGAPLYTAPELGGFHHFLTVQVIGKQADVQLHRVGAPTSRLLKPRIIRPGEVLESWDQGLLCYAWDRSANVELTSTQASQGHRGLRLNFDLEQYAWPVLVLPFGSARDFSDCRAISLDVYLPKQSPDNFSVSTAVQGVEKHEAQLLRLKPGWNTVTTKLSQDWFPPAERRAVQGLEWSLSAGKPSGKGYIVFDNLRLERTQPGDNSKMELLESWERPLLWRVFDETIEAGITPPDILKKPKGLALHLDWSKCNRPILFAQLNPPWDLTGTKALTLRAEAADLLPEDLTIELTFRSKDVEFAGGRKPLRQGANEIAFSLEGGWLTSKTRAEAEQVAFRLVTTNTNGRGEVIFQQLRASGGL